MANQWNLIRYHWELGEDGMPHLYLEAIIDAIEGELSQAERLAIVTNYVSENVDRSRDFRWINTTGDDDCWEYYLDDGSLFLTPVYSIYPRSECGLMVMVKG